MNRRSARQSGTVYCKYYNLQGMHPVVLTYTTYLFIRHNTTLNISFTLTVYNEFIDFNRIMLHVSADEKLSSGRYTLLNYS
jgi:hypothetical protein